MPHSGDLNTEEGKVAGQGLAVAAESLYVANLLLIPGLGFLILGYLFVKHRNTAPPIAHSHLEQTVFASIWVGIMFAGIGAMVLLLKYMGLEDVSVWMIVVIVFTIVHATMVLFGVLGLAKAMSGKCWRYPAFGARLPSGCPE